MALWKGGGLYWAGQAQRHQPVVPVRGYLEGIRRLMKGDCYVGRGSKQRGLKRSHPPYCCASFPCDSGLRGSLSTFSVSPLSSTGGYRFFFRSRGGDLERMDSSGISAVECTRVRRTLCGGGALTGVFSEMHHSNWSTLSCWFFGVSRRGSCVGCVERAALVFGVTAETVCLPLLTWSHGVRGFRGRRSEIGD